MDSWCNFIIFSQVNVYLLVFFSLVYIWITFRVQVHSVFGSCPTHLDDVSHFNCFSFLKVKPLQNRCFSKRWNLSSCYEESRESCCVWCQSNYAHVGWCWLTCHSLCSWCSRDDCGSQQRYTLSLCNFWWNMLEAKKKKHWENVGNNVVEAVDSNSQKRVILHYHMQENMMWSDTVHATQETRGRNTTET